TKLLMTGTEPMVMTRSILSGTVTGRPVMSTMSRAKALAAISDAPIAITRDRARLRIGCGLQGVACENRQAGPADIAFGKDAHRRVIKVGQEFRGQQFPWCSDAENPAAPQAQDIRADQQGVVGVMRRHQDRIAAPCERDRD